MPVDPLMDEHIKEALGTTRTLHKRLDELDDARCEPLKKLAARANKAVQAIQRCAHAESLRADVRESILREAVRGELIDREANAARVLERHRLFAEEGGSSSTAPSTFERARTAAASVEASIASLCSHRSRHAPGIALLAASVRDVHHADETR